MVALDISLKSLVVSKKLIQPVLIQLVGCTLCSDNGGTGVTGCLSKVTSSMLKKLIQPVLIQLVGHVERTQVCSIIDSVRSLVAYSTFQ